jgi:MarR family transcriptional regulator, organic hydroperoxide resistance regulator
MALRFIPRLHKATHAIAVHLHRRREQIPVTQAEAHVLSYLSERGGACSIADLHRSFGHKRSTLTGIVDRLEKRRMVEREIHPEDRRSFVLSLTPKGGRLARQVRVSLEQLERSVLRQVTPAQLEGFLALADAIEAASSPHGG